MNTLENPLYIGENGVTGVYIIFLIFAQKHSLQENVELPHWVSSNVHLQSVFGAKTRKVSSLIFLKLPFLHVGPWNSALHCVGMLSDVVMCSMQKMQQVYIEFY